MTSSSYGQVRQIPLPSQLEAEYCGDKHTQGLLDTTTFLSVLRHRHLGDDVNKST
jgi:hypothetical protein